nr:MAG TPA: hypothetical protein [Caudoviricetes sp.]
MDRTSNFDIPNCRCVQSRGTLPAILRLEIYHLTLLL